MRWPFSSALASRVIGDKHHVCLNNRLYNLINKRLPGWQDPPKRAEIMNALRAYDEDGNGTLDEKEFELFARSLMKTGPDAFFARVGKSAVVQTAFLPAAAAAVQKLTPNSPVRVRCVVDTLTPKNPPCRLATPHCTFWHQSSAR